MPYEPDFENILRVLRREVPARPTLFEFFLNGRLYRHLAGAYATEASDPFKQLLMLVHAFKNAGYDYATTGGSSFSFPRGERARDKTCSLNEGALVTDRASFEAYPWPDPDAFEYDILARIEPELPGGMKLMIGGPGGVLENVIGLTGYDNLCFMIADEPELARDVFDAVGSRLLRYYERSLEYPSMGILMSNDDWGFKTQTMLAPADMRRYVFPWHKRFVAAAHAAGRPAVLHSCGKFDEVFDDIVDEIGFDGRHSYEDAILPVEEAYERYGDRVAILGGIDVDFLVRNDPDAIYRRSRAMLERSAERGGYALGTGNSVPEYIDDEKYFAMTRAVLESREGCACAGSVD